MFGVGDSDDDQEQTQAPLIDVTSTWFTNMILDKMLC